MSKRIFIIDSCEHCPFVSLHSSVLPGGTPLMKILTCKFHPNEECPSEGFPEWCPFPAMPVRENTISTYQLRKLAAEKGITGPQANGWKMGWNDCLDAIGAGGEPLIERAMADEIERSEKRRARWKEET